MSEHEVSNPVVIDTNWFLILKEIHELQQEHGRKLLRINTLLQFLENGDDIDREAKSALCGRLVKSLIPDMSKEIEHILQNADFQQFLDVEISPPNKGGADSDNDNPQNTQLTTNTYHKFEPHSPQNQHTIAIASTRFEPSPCPKSNEGDNQIIGNKSALKSQPSERKREPRCVYCGLLFYRRFDLLYHLRKQHGIVRQNMPNINMPPPIVDMPPPIVRRQRPIVRLPCPIVDIPPTILDMPPPIVEMPPTIVEMPPTIVEMPPPIVEMPPPIVRLPCPTMQRQRPIVDMRPQIVDIPPPIVRIPRRIVRRPRRIVRLPPPIVDIPPPILDMQPPTVELTPPILDLFTPTAEKPTITSLRLNVMYKRFQTIEEFLKPILEPLPKLPTLDETTQIYCGICSRKFTTDFLLMKLLGPEYICKKCQAKIKRQEKKKKFPKNKVGSPNLRCSYCRIKFISELGLANHTSNMHILHEPNEFGQTLTCGRLGCAQKFIDERELRIHWEQNHLRFIKSEKMEIGEIENVN